MVIGYGLLVIEGGVFKVRGCEAARSLCIGKVQK